MNELRKKIFLFNSFSLNIELNINQLLLVNAHLGHTRRFLNVKIKPYLLGYRGNIYILNLSFTLHQFKLVAINIINLISVRRAILVIKDRARINLKSIFKTSYIHYYDNK
jgi:ribosomal protein S2